VSTQPQPSPPALPITDAIRALSDARVRVVQVPTAARVADALREQVSEGHFRPGSRMPEEAIGQALGVSRNTVREAFVELTGERLLVREPNRGVFVAVPDAAAVTDIYRARRVLEIGAVRAGGPAELVAQARKAVDEGMTARAAGDGAGVGTANQHFHRALVDLAGSSRLNRLMGQMLAEIRLVFQTGNLLRDFYLAYLDDNAALCTLLEAGDFTGAADALDDYLRRSEDQVLQAMSAGHG
jgi:DNA-binding GntR family transcriptional regulator